LVVAVLEETKQTALPVQILCLAQLLPQVVVVGVLVAALIQRRD